MTSADYLRLLRRQWYVVAACVVLGLLAGLVVSAVVPPTYEARATLYFSTVVSAPGSNVSAYETNLLAQQQVKSISLLVGTERVAQDVVDDLRLPVSAAELSPHLTATSDPDTVVLVVAATDSSPRRSADIANSTGRALVRLTDTINKENAAANLPTVVPTVRAAIIQAAGVPATPTAGTRTANLLGGLLAGLLVGMAVVLLRKLLDRKVRDGDELMALSGAPGMGATPRSGGVKARPVSVVDDPGSGLASAYRQLRVNVGVAMAGTRTLAVVSPGSGDGRTSVICNLAVAFAESGYRVAVLEADLRNPRIGAHLGVDDVPGLAEVLSGTRRVDQVVRRWDGRVDVVLAGRARDEPGHLVASRQLLTVLDELRSDHDIVLVDTPAGSVASDVTLLGSRTEAVLLVARAGRTRKAEVERLAEALYLASGNVVGSVLTMEKRPRFRRRPEPVRPPSRSAVEPADLDPATVRNLPAVQVADRTTDDAPVRAANGYEPRIPPVQAPGLRLPVPASSLPAPAAPGRSAPGYPVRSHGAAPRGSTPAGLPGPPAAPGPVASGPAAPGANGPAPAAPAKSAPAKPAASAPAQAASAAPLKPVADAPTQQVTVKPAATAPVKPAATAPAQPATAKPASAAPLKPVADAPTQQVTVKPAATAPARPAATAPVKPAASAPARPATAKPAAAATAKPAADAPTQQVTAKPAATVPAKPAATVPAQPVPAAAVRSVPAPTGSTPVEPGPAASAPAGPTPAPSPVRTAAGASSQVAAAQVSASQVSASPVSALPPASTATAPDSDSGST